MSSSKIPDISLCLIVKNEEANLKALLETTRGLKAQTIVVDTGSSDRTIEIAKSFGAQVVEWAWRSDFAAARNISLDHAKGRWALWLDADDRLPPDSIPELLALAAQPAEKAYAMLVKNSLDDGKTGSVFSQIRMFPNHPRIRFTGAVHEQVYPALEAQGIPFEYTSIKVLHTGYTDPATVRAKQERNRQILRKRVEHENVGAIEWYQLGCAEGDLQDWETGEACFLKAIEKIRQGDADKHLMSLLPGGLVSMRIPRNDLDGAWRLLQEHLQGGPADWHPGQRALVGKMVSAFESPEAGLVFFEKTFEPQDRPALLPVNHTQVCTQALEPIAAYWHDNGRDDIAVEVLRILRNFLEGQSIAPSALARLYLAKGLPQRAAELFAWCLETDPQVAEDWDGLVQALRQSNDPEWESIQAQVQKRFSIP